MTQLGKQIKPVASRTFAANDVKADKLPLETEPVAGDNNMIFPLKPDDQTWVAPYSTDNRSIWWLDFTILKKPNKTLIFTRHPFNFTTIHFQSSLIVFYIVIKNNLVRELLYGI